MVLAAGTAAYAALGANDCSEFSTLALRNARLFDGTGQSPRNGMTVAMLGGNIIAVGSDADVKLGRDTQVIDCAGAFVMPGVIDTHVHVTEPLVRGDRTLLPGWLRGGVTTVRDTGTIFQGPELLRNLVNEHDVAPRVIATGGLMTVPGGYPTSRGPVGEAGSLQVATVDAAIAGVNATLDAGGEFIKVAIETGIPGGRLLEDAGAPTLSLEQVQAIVQTAHGRGARVIAHVTNEWELARALDGGVDALAHTPLDDIPDSFIDVMVARSIQMTATLNIWGSASVARGAQRNVLKFAQAGGAVAMGTDYPFQLHAGMPIEELRMMRGSGLSETQVLVACTSGAAAACGRADLGVIAKGAVADAIIVDGDPTLDIDDLSRVTAVVHDGVQVR